MYSVESIDMYTINTTIYFYFIFGVDTYICFTFKRVCNMIYLLYG